eukprot:3053822-Amphidinium_carterae.1
MAMRVIQDKVGNSKRCKELWKRLLATFVFVLLVDSEKPKYPKNGSTPKLDCNTANKTMKFLNLTWKQLLS